MWHVWERIWNHIGISWETLCERDSLEDTCVYVKIILKRIWKLWDGQCDLDTSDWG